MRPPKEKPKVELVGEDGNAFAILGRVSKALKKAGADKEYIDQYTEKAMSGDYDYLLMVTLEYLNIWAEGFVTHNDCEIDTSGSCLKGCIASHYDNIVRVFGEPFKSEDVKTDVEWFILFDDGMVAAIYDYKESLKYWAGGKPTELITEWNIGGMDAEVVDRIRELLK